MAKQKSVDCIWQPNNNNINDNKHIDNDDNNNNVDNNGNDDDDEDNNDYDDNDDNDDNFETEAVKNTGKIGGISYFEILNSTKKEILPDLINLN